MKKTGKSVFFLLISAALILNCSLSAHTVHAEEETEEIPEESEEVIEESDLQEEAEETEEEPEVPAEDESEADYGWEERMLTYIPEELEYDVPVSHSQADILNGENLETEYSSRDARPPVRNQDPYGACWTFASVGAAEADLIHDGVFEKDEIDLSELQLAYFNAFNYVDPKGNHTGDDITYTGSDHYLDNGGNAVVAYRAMANMVGLVDESEVPYKDAATLVPDMKYAVSMDKAQLEKACVISAEDRDGIKQAIKEHGGVAGSMYANRAYYNLFYPGYYYDGISSPNHAIMLVGWDDSYPRKRMGMFSHPEHDGAWLVRNSWGKNGTGYNGYFWMSYEDSVAVHKEVYAYDMSTDVYDHCYSYDSVPFPGYKKMFYGNKADLETSFTVDGNELVGRVGFETGSADLTVTAVISDGTDSAQKTIQTTHAGFYTVDFEQPLFVSERRDITVHLQFEWEGQDPLIILVEGSGKTSQAKIIYTGAQSGPGITVNGDKLEYDARVKLYTRDGSGAKGTALHQKETLTKGEYSTAETAEFYAPSAGTEATPSVKTYEGFTSPAAQSIILSGSGTETVTYQYDRNSYTASLSAADGVVEVRGSGTYRFEETVTPEVEFQPGYELDSWTGDISSAPFVMPAKNITASVSGKPSVYSIVYALDGGTVDGTNPEQYTVNSDAITLINPKKEGYVFKGWTGTGIDGNPVMSAVIPAGSTGDRTYTANWNKIVSVAVEHQKETLEAGVYETAERETRTGEYGETLHIDGKKYIGFSASDALDVTIDSEEDMTVPYRYTRNSYRLSVNRGPGIASVSGSGNYKYEQQATVSCTLSDGYEFDRWDGDYSEPSFAMPAEHVSMTAYGKLIIYPITYDLDGGSVTVSNPDSYTVLSKSFTLNNPVKEGYAFKGWSGTGLTGDENRTVTVSEGSIGQRSYTAHWTRTEPEPTPTPTPTPSTETIQMYRMYNPNSGEHFYTGNEQEKDMLVKTGWNFEGEGFTAPKSSSTPMYRLYNENAGDHHYTSSKEERDHLISIGWKDEGIGWYADDAKGVAMYRLYNPNCIGAGSHHYTSNAQEKAHLIRIGWKDEGVGFYACR